MHLWLGSGRVETLVVDEFRPYWHRIRAQLATVLDAGTERPRPTVPEPCPHCAFCEFFDDCAPRSGGDEDSLIYVAGIRAARAGRRWTTAGSRRWPDWRR